MFWFHFRLTACIPGTLRIMCVVSALPQSGSPSCVLEGASWDGFRLGMSHGKTGMMREKGTVPRRAAWSTENDIGDGRLSFSLGTNV